MFAKLSNKYVLVALSVAAVVIVLGINSQILQPSYIGSDVKLSNADKDSTIKIDDAVMSMPPKMKSGVQASIQITKFAGNYAQGKVSYSDKSPTQQFMAVKAGDNWTIIANNSGKRLDLPDVKTAKRYGLPKDWFKS